MEYRRSPLRLSDSNAECVFDHSTPDLSFEGSRPPSGAERSSSPESPIQQRTGFEETMSNGAPPQVADPPPPFNGHTHGHSRTRGHDRSRQWAQPPPTFSLGSSNGSPTKLTESDYTLNSSYPYSHGSQPSFPLYNHSPSHAISHHDRAHSVASIHHDAAHDHDLKGKIAAPAEYGSEQMYVNMAW